MKRHAKQTRVTAAAKLPPAATGKPPLGRLKLDRVLSEADRPAYEQLLSNPRLTLREARQWLRERGYQVGPPAVANHRRQFAQELVDIRQAARQAIKFAKAATRAGGMEALAAASLARISQVALQHLFQREQDKQDAALSPRDLADLTRTLAAAIGAASKLQIYKKQLDRVRRAANPRRPAEDARQVAMRVREILGVSLPTKSADGNEIDSTSTNDAPSEPRP